MLAFAFFSWDFSRVNNSNEKKTKQSNIAIFDCESKQFCILFMNCCRHYELRFFAIISAHYLNFLQHSCLRENGKKVL